jgi:hydrogenase nickel incorporation protein HypB
MATATTGTGTGAANTVTVSVMEGILDANDALAQANRDKFNRAGTYVVNIMSSPGSGKTTILERTLEKLQGRLRTGVLEGDVQTSLDAARLERFGVPVVQINTGSAWGGGCHLDANMVRCGLPSLPLDEIDLLFIENVGNLVCPAGFLLGEDTRVIVASVTEGEDKPLKYPHMFRCADLILVNKSDLLAHLDFDLTLLMRNIKAVNPDAPSLLISARTGEGVDEWLDWLVGRAGG